MKTQRTILLKAQTHQGDIELPLTESKALAFAKKLFKNHQKEKAKWTGEYSRRNWDGTRTVYKASGPEPFLNLEFIKAEA